MSWRERWVLAWLLLRPVLGMGPSRWLEGAHWEKTSLGSGTRPRAGLSSLFGFLLAAIWVPQERVPSPMTRGPRPLGERPTHDGDAAVLGGG